MSDTVSIEPHAGRRPAWRAWLIVGLLAFLIGLAAMAYFMKRYENSGSTPVAPTPAPSAAQPVAALPAVAPIVDLPSLNAREAALSGRLAALEARLPAVATASQAAAGNATRAEGLLVAFAARRALDRGLALGYIEEQLRLRFGSVQPRAVGTVIQASREPVTLEDLRMGIEAIAPQLVTGAPNDGWGASFKRELSNLITLRKEGTPSPRPADRLARARRMLEGGQVEGALAEVARLPGATNASNWLTAAKRYIEARKALDVIETAAILGQASPATSAADAVAPDSPDATAPAEFVPPEPLPATAN
ncbi:hypothetical protein BH09PSE4_BH09PSE4_03030 [soil metagenome]